jgi:hypothetical protein
LWRTSDPKVATVSDAGVVTAVALGTATIWTTETNGMKNSGNCTVTVEQPKVLSSVDVFKTVSPAVFYIEMFNYKGEKYGSASGFFVAADGTAYTNYHVIDGATSAKITMADGKTYTDIKVIGFDRFNDIAILKVGGAASFPYVALGDSDNLQSGEKVYAIGNPEGLKNTISDGMVSNTALHPYTDSTYADRSVIQTSAPISHGSSGGVLVNEYAEVIGITSGGMVDGQNLNWAVPINIAKNLALRTPETLKEHEDNLYGSIPNIGDNVVNSLGNNTTLSQAQMVKNGDTVSGTLTDCKTYNLFSITVEAEGRLEVLFGSNKDNNDNLVLFLIDDNNEVADYGVQGYSDFYIKTPGTYHVAIGSMEENGHTNIPYELFFMYTKNY